MQSAFRRHAVYKIYVTVPHCTCSGRKEKPLRTLPRKYPGSGSRSFAILCLTPEIQSVFIITAEPEEKKGCSSRDEHVI